ncbi:MAG: 50S ribosomal protein L25 [Solirubrobacterales bacterium]|nr:50S ribosomal protein L25 [Solirubrobacterales bacterium]
MSDQSSAVLAASRRESSNSRENRRLRRTGLVPGIVYGGGEEPVPFSINARELRNTLASAGAVLDLQIDGGKATPVVLKELIRHPVTGSTTHLDLLRVNLKEAIQTQVTLELTGAEDAPGIKQGGVLEHIAREVTVEALPNEIPESLSVDVSTLEVGETVTQAAIQVPTGVTLIGDEEAAVVTITASRASRQADDEIETETELVGEESDGEEAASEDDE